MKKHLLLTAGISLFAGYMAFTQSHCGIWYVSPGGTGTEGSVSSPTTLKHAVLNATSDRNVIRLLEGAYTVDTVLSLQDNMLIEGAYVLQSGKWIKKTNAVSEITFSGTESIDGNIEHVIGLKADGVNNWKLADLSLTTVDASGSTTNGVGKSVYTIWAKDATGALISRVKVSSGNGSNGTDGAAPSGLGGGNIGGTGGNPGNYSSGCSNGNAGSQGGAGLNGGAPGGSAGSAGSSGGCNVFNCDKNPGNGGNGGTGVSGGTGSGFAANDRPASPSATSDYYVPQTTPQNGGSGIAGGGGGGGGGAARGTCCSCSCGCEDNACGNGGIGGRGGDGGAGGNGGKGGGSSFPLYVAGTSQISVNDSELTPGNGGSGGNGSLGAPGTIGLNGNSGIAGTRCGTTYTGGNGGKGGDGGQGGRGRDGANGLATAYAEVNAGSITVNGSVIANSEELSAETGYVACTNSEITITKPSGSWALPTGGDFVKNTSPVSSSYNANSGTAIVVFNNVGSYKLDNGTTNAPDFIQITNTRALPVINSVPSSLCQGYSVNLGTSAIAEEYDWIIYSPTINQILYSSSAQNPGPSIPLNNIATYTIRLRVKDACCGWSAPVYQAISVTSPSGCVSISEAEGFDFNIFPNPFQNELTIAFGNPIAEDATMRIVDASGRVVQASNLPALSGNVVISTGDMANGVYIFELHTNNGVYTKKLIKQ